MTFTEAAVEVLRLVGKPLHYKKITEIAIERNLLSHVGKTPEVTMSSRLATMVKKDRGEAPIIKVKPGVFGLRDFAQDVIAQAEGDTGLDYELPEGYVRHYQTTDDGKRLEAILMFSPDYDFVDEHGNTVQVPDDGIVPPDMAPADIPLRRLEVPVDDAPHAPSQPPGGH